MWATRCTAASGSRACVSWVDLASPGSLPNARKAGNCSFSITPAQSQFEEGSREDGTRSALIDAGGGPTNHEVATASHSQMRQAVVRLPRCVGIVGSKNVLFFFVFYSSPEGRVFFASVWWSEVLDPTNDN